MKKALFLINMRILIVLVILLVPSILFAAEVILVANKNVPDNILSKDEVRAFFLGEKTRWSDNRSIVFVIYRVPAEMKTFTKYYVGKTPFQYDNYWKCKVFTGMGGMPRAFDNVDDLIRYIAKTDGAITYVPKDTPLGKVKEITVK